MSNYHQRVLEGRKQFLRLVMEQEKELLSVYEEAAKQVADKLSKVKAGGLSARYLSELDKTINQYISELRNNLTETIKDGIEASSQIASAVQLGYLNSIAPREDILATFNKMFMQLPTGIVKQLINDSYYADGKTLNNRIWDLTSKNASDIDRLIKINVAKGVNARELAKQLDAYINPTKKIDAKTLEAGMNKNISYQAQRLSRTSLTHAHNETYIQGSKMNPFCRGLKWNLSPSHYERQVERWGRDICDEYATRDSFSRGQGVYPADKYPVSHPNCLCYPTQENVPVERAREEIINWLNCGSNTLLDRWADKYGEEFGIERNQSKAFNEIAASKGENSGIIKERNINIYPNEQLPPKHTLSNKEARIWYLEHEKLIGNLVDIDLSLKEKAVLAYEIRNEYRTMARELMSDRDLANELNRSEKNKTFDELVEKYKSKGLNGDEIWIEIIESSMRSRKSVNKSLGLE